MELHTKRLHLRPWRSSDAADLYILARNPQIGPMAGWKPHKNLQESKKAIETGLKSEGNFAICLKAGDLVGSVTLKSRKDSYLRLEKDEAEIGCWLSQDYWGFGIASEAIRAVLDYAFNVLSFSRVFALSYSDNKRSLIMQKSIGFLDEGYHVKDLKDIKGARRPAFMLVMTKEHWKEHCAGRQARKSSSLLPA
jgi:RimJ/RimL family protein N-acetyltransferase